MFAILFYFDFDLILIFFFGRAVAWIVSKAKRLCLTKIAPRGISALRPIPQFPQMPQTALPYNNRTNTLPIQQHLPHTAFLPCTLPSIHHLPSPLHSNNKQPTPRPTHHHLSHIHCSLHARNPYTCTTQPMSSRDTTSAHTLYTAPFHSQM